MTSADAYAPVFAFLRDNFPGYSIDPLHCQFTDNQFGPAGEIKHVPYGTGSIKAGPLAEAAAVAGMRMTVISEAKEQSSHDAIFADLKYAMVEPAATDDGRHLGSGAVDFPTPMTVTPDGDGWRLKKATRPLRVKNLDKPFFGDGYTKGDLLQ